MQPPSLHLHFCSSTLLLRCFSPALISIDPVHVRDDPIIVKNIHSFMARKALETESLKAARGGLQLMDDLDLIFPKMRIGANRGRTVHPRLGAWRTNHLGYAVSLSKSRFLALMVSFNRGCSQGPATLNSESWFSAYCLESRLMLLGENRASLSMDADRPMRVKNPAEPMVLYAEKFVVYDISALQNYPKRLRKRMNLRCSSSHLLGVWICSQVHKLFPQDSFPSSLRALSRC
ncbi:hypothetical protein VNO77_43662 [Canavalia gladiata]|uniref:Uncharacterized protein n=1 Tax=Canavalia gladiata TaxID=3824 RepID=A0AAN9JXI6_CANGL